ncbi:hypothetical protein A0H81_09070 [Grifola frondosa]|uniref:Zinc-finger domain-containing protein n=1 Tax=Grifola frondosa TaxID=5627 RepID=A0A1C7M0U5_GRIFR|nr:hypothetical protein A0H81_09070 [Grifola frondosa]
MPTCDEVPRQLPKKARVSATANSGDQANKPKGLKLVQAAAKTGHGVEEFPNGSFYCHQCTKKRDMADGVQCTFKTDSSRSDNLRCKAKYCKACLKNRYGADLSNIKARDVAALTKRERSKHIDEDSYYFQCPRCSGDCNCRACRKAKGLKPTGNLTLLARKTGVGSAADMLSNDPNTVGILPGQGVAKEIVPKARAKKIAAASTDAPIETKGKGKETLARPAPKPKAAVPKPRAAPPKPKAAVPPRSLPKPMWTPMHTCLTLDDAEVRMHIREFVLRFSHILDIGKGNLEELEEISAANRRWNRDDEEAQEFVGWVTEPCVKSIILGLLGLLATHAYDDTVTKAIKTSMKEIRSSGANLTRIWAALASLRRAFQSVSLTFADPLPPPSSATYHRTRNGVLGNKDNTSIYVADAAQLVPVVANLIELVLETPRLREDFERGATQEKDIAKAVREVVAAENAAWKERKTAHSKIPDDLKARHQQRLLDLEHAQSVVLFDCIPRFGPIGRDHEGRVYYILTPGVVERDAALELIDGKAGKVRFGRKKGPTTRAERQQMEKWSWFVAVWGNKPDGAILAHSEDSDSENEEAEGEQWWGFWDPAEIRKVADWIDIKCHLGDTDSGDSDATAPIRKGKEVAGRASLASSEIHTDSSGHLVATTQDLRKLVKALHQHADLLDWRIKRVAVDEQPKITETPPERFYG